ncbi:MAG: TfoX family protein [Caulobacteraceae bacterium]|nr:TfoX family protein [Caulobacteraceae bacterium]
MCVSIYSHLPPDASDHLLTSGVTQMDDLEVRLVDLFEPLGPVVVKPMFGGQGVWFQGRMFALAFGGTVYVKVDDRTVAVFRAAGSRPFVYQQKSRNREASLNYFSLPDNAADDPAEASRWGRLGIEAAFRTAARNTKRAARADIGPGPWDG